MAPEESSLSSEVRPDSNQPPAAEPVTSATGPQQETPPLPPVPREPALVQEVEAVPLSATEPVQRTIDAPPSTEPVHAAAPPAPSQPSAATGIGNVPPASSIPPPPPVSTQPPVSSPPPISGPPPAPPPPPRESPWRRRKQFIWSILCHLLLILVLPTMFVGMAITFLIWQLKGKNDRLVEDQGREALNFQINVAGLTALLGITCLGSPLIPIVWFVAVIMAIVAARHASDGETYRYPWVLRIVTH